MTVYRARTIKRDRSTRAQIEQLEAQILAEVKADNPQSVRHIYYRMTDPRLPEAVEKSQRGYRHVQDRCVKMRRSGVLPYQWIADTTRHGYFVNTYRGKKDFLRSMAGHYRADLWQYSDHYCEVWCESRSIAAVILADCQELAVSLYPAAGFSSLTLPFEAAQSINESFDGRPITIFYIGDYDPAGVIIDMKVEQELRRHLDANIPLSFERIAITKKQIRQYKLPEKPRKIGDRRSLHVKKTVEAEAMPAHILRELLRDRIEALLPVDALRVAKLAEQSERAGLKRIADAIRGGT
jgi:hypothetical protein